MLAVQECRAAMCWLRCAGCTARSRGVGAGGQQAGRIKESGALRDGVGIPVAAQHAGAVHLDRVRHLLGEGWHQVGEGSA